MIEKKDIIKITNQVVLLIAIVLITMFFIEIQMSVYLIPIAQKLSVNVPFLALLIGIFCLSGLNVVLIIFIKEPQKKECMYSGD